MLSLSAAGCQAAPVRLTPDALKAYFPDAASIQERDIQTENAQAFIIMNSDGGCCTAIVRQGASRSSQFTLFMVLTPERRIKDVRVLRYAGSRGRKSKSQAFLDQFMDKGPEDPIQAGEDIDTVTGATLSCKRMINIISHTVKKTRY